MKSILEIVTILTFVFCITMLQSMDRPGFWGMHRYPPPMPPGATDTTGLSVGNAKPESLDAGQLNKSCNEDEAKAAKPGYNQTMANSKEDSLKGGPVVIPAGYYSHQ